jgi:hypothetical protein
MTRWSAVGVVVMVWPRWWYHRAIYFNYDAGGTVLQTQPRRLTSTTTVSYLSLTLWLYTLLDASHWLMLVTLYWCCCSGAIYLSNWSSSSGLCYGALLLLYAVMPPIGWLNHPSMCDLLLCSYIWNWILAQEMYRWSVLDRDIPWVLKMFFFVYSDIWTEFLFSYDLPRL